ncbi:MAG TPA: 3'-5' exonuclease, partial [Bacteroidia bacterium]|nr:3'-5' exonuclease [Bacteroidia bacterium]
PRGAKILYLAFNKSVKLEAQRKFLEAGLKNVQIETAHSLAYKQIVFKHKYKVRVAGYKTHEIVDLLGLSGGEERHTEYILANHILRFISYYCNSDKTDIAQLNYRETISDRKALQFVNSFYSYILNKTADLLSKMDKGEIEITHDFYLKKFQLSAPLLDFDFILFDEGQDASAAMLDIFLKQSATKVIVGDTHQQIYGWRYAVNSLEKTDFQNYFLSTSFRFPPDIAILAMKMLELKTKVNPGFVPVQVNGAGNNSEIRSKAIIARTNLGLLRSAIEHVSSGVPVSRLYFEGNIYSYTYAEDGASLYDVLNLYNGKRHLIRDALIKKMRSMDELAEYVEKTEDAQMKMMKEIVEDYGNEIPGILKRLKEKHVENDDKHQAELIFSTVHRCKGMEYDEVELMPDFITDSKIDKMKNDSKNNPLSLPKINEEINLLYVAVTRTRTLVKIPQELMPKGFPESKNIKVKEDGMPVEMELKMQEESYMRFLDKKLGRGSANDRFRKALEEYYERKNSGIRDIRVPDNIIPSFDISDKREKSYDVEMIRQMYKGAYRKWTPELDEELMEMHENGYTEKEMAEHFGRTTGAIASRIAHLEMSDEERAEQKKIEKNEKLLRRYS